MTKAVASELLAEGVSVFVGLGSNLAAPMVQLHRALCELGSLPQTRVKRVSQFYWSEPLGGLEQPEYLNAVTELETKLAPLPLLQLLQDIELRQGRVRTDQRWAPRIIDLDILLYGVEIINEMELIIPHPGIVARNFVLVPLRELVGDQFVIPKLGPLEQLLRQCPSTGLRAAVR